MKIVAYSTAALTFAAVIGLTAVSSISHASGAKETFAAMKHAFELQKAHVLYMRTDAKTGEGVWVGMVGPGAPGESYVISADEVRGSGNSVTALGLLPVDMAPANYASIQYGGSKQTLELVPRGSADRRYEVALNAANLPQTRKTFVKKDDKWVLGDVVTFKFSVPLK
jgi:hypothetical protein